MEQVIEVTETTVEPVEEQQIIELSLDLLDKVGGGTISLRL